MFQSLSDKLGKVFDGLRGKRALEAEDVELATREIRMALLEADVALPVVKDFIAQMREKAVGQEIIKSVSPAQQVVKIVHDGIVDLLGGAEANPIATEGATPIVYLMAGLQGSGKTTTSGKLGKFLTDKHRKKVMLASLDTQRPAAQDQLRILGEQTNVATLPIVPGQDVLAIAKRALETARLEAYDVLILDTAGRLSIDDALMAEVASVHSITNPAETLLVVDAMTGQDAVNTAKAFNDRLNVTGIVLTRIDGDARGGAAMSMKAVTGKPIKLIGTGEKIDAIEAFHAERIAGRILGMGDVVSLVEKAAAVVDREQAEAMAKKFQEGKFDLDDFAKQLKQMRDMGGMSGMAKLLPGISRFAGEIEKANIDNTVVRRQEAMLSSMTKSERANPRLIRDHASRRRRIAIGSGTTVQEVNRLLNQFEQMQKMMNQIRKMGMGGIMKMARGLMGNNNMDQLMASQGTPEEMEALLRAENNGDPLGPNPFLQGRGGAAPGGLPRSFFTKSRKGKRK